MFKKAILSFSAALCLGGGVSFAQTKAPCTTDQHHKDQLRQFPQIADVQAQLEKEVENYVQYQMFGVLPKNNLAGKGTSVWDTVSSYYRIDTAKEYHIPIVVHIVHNYGTEYISDNKVYEMIKRLNVYYNKRNADTSDVIRPFKQYIGNAKITFHLATKDPFGQPTTGITRHYSYTTNGGDEYAKTGQWPANRYLNIWSENRIGRPIQGGIVAAYSRFPSDGYVNPYGDGIISNSQFIGSTENTIEHEIGHYLNLLHVWNSNNAGACLGPSGDDAVDDTPPTRGHFSGVSASCGCPLYDTLYSLNYSKTYQYDSPTIFDTTYVPRPSNPSIKDTVITPRKITATVDFPDTNNVQNIMDYSDCTRMFTKGQVMRMRATLESNTTTRPNLTTDSNLFITGAWKDLNGTPATTPDLAPIADFSVNRNFICATQTNVTFTNRTWRDTATAEWTLVNGNPATSTSTSTLIATFSQPGWADISLKANSNAGTNTIQRKDLVYIANPTAVPAEGYFQEFNDGTDLDQYPIFNYYNNSYKWEFFKNAGFYDNTCIKFNNYDPRPAGSLTNMTQTPNGNYSDFFTRGFDVTGPAFSSNANLTFYYAGAYRIINPSLMNDSLVVSYSSDCGSNWVRLGAISKGAISTYGTSEAPFVPSWMGNWKFNGFALPAAAKTSRVFFRFRYYSGTDNGSLTGYEWGTGNHFYLDRIHISGYNVGVNGIEPGPDGISVAPNPTQSGAVVTIKGGDNSAAVINVTDITGKLVYQTEINLAKDINSVEIPADRIAVKGMYLVNVTSNGNKQTRKLVVY